MSSDNELPFVDYFVVAGLNKDTGLEIEKFFATLEPGTSRPPLEQSYVARILGHYPDKRMDRPFYPEILSLCMPKGLRFCTQKDQPSQPSFHTFAVIREDGSRVDGCVLSFYEEVTDADLRQAMHILHTSHVREITSMREESTRTHRKHGNRRSLEHGAGGESHTLPNRGRKDKHKRTSYYDSAQDSLFVSKCLCLVCRLPMVSAGRALLLGLYSLLIVGPHLPPPLPAESYIYWLLNELPLPPPGSTLKVTLASCDIIFQRPGLQELPFFDYSLCRLFDLVSVDNFLKLYTSVLLEQQILLCSRTLDHLMLLAESLTALVFPFLWAHVYVPIIPYSQALFLEAPVPFIMGLCYDDAIPEQVFQSNVCVFDIDYGRLQLPEDLPLLPDRAELATELELAMSRWDNYILSILSIFIDLSMLHFHTVRFPVRLLDR